MKRSNPTFLLLASLALVPQTSALADQIIDIQGGAMLRRENKAKAEAAAVGMELHYGDWLSPTSGSVVWVQCLNNTISQVRLPSGLGNICSDSAARRFHVRGRGEDDFLAFLNQRFIYATQFLDPKPQLRWNPVAEGTQYKVQIFTAPGSQDPIWETNTDQSQVVYDGPSLKPGQHYRLVVQTRENNQDKTLVRLVFSLLIPESAQNLQTQVSQLAKEGLSKEGMALSVVNLYQETAQPNTDPPEGVGLVMESLPILQEVTSQNSQIPYHYRLLGDLSLQVGLLDQAKNSYQQVFKLTEDSSDVANRAAAQVGLANIAAAMGDLPSAETYLKQALMNYSSLEKVERVSLIEEWLAKLRLRQKSSAIAIRNVTTFLKFQQFWFL